MQADELQFEARELLRHPAGFAVIFFLLAVALLSVAVGTAWLAISITGQSPPGQRSAFVVSFLISTGLLVAGSVQLVRASTFVQLERQASFRRCMAWAMVCGTAFVSVQTYGLQSLISLNTADIATGLKYAAFVFIFLHAVHVIVALLFVVYVFLRAQSDRYDHEYSWGVTFCGWFWHGLGVVWLAIMAVFTVAGSVTMVAAA